MPKIPILRKPKFKRPKFKIPIFNRIPILQIPQDIPNNAQLQIPNARLIGNATLQTPIANANQISAILKHPSDRAKE